MTKREPAILRGIKAVFAYSAMVLGAMALTAFCFLVLPLIQSINQPIDADLLVQEVNLARIDPPPPPPEEEEPEEEEPEPEAEPPELREDTPPIDLDQLEMAMNSSFGTGGEFMIDQTVDLNKVAGGGESVDAIFSLDDLDQKPRAMFQPSPNYSAQLRKRAPATVYVIFVVDERGKVTNPIVQSSTDAAFEPAALAAVKQWKFEPGVRGGKPVKFRVRQPITFPK